MSAKENVFSALIVMAIGFTVLLLIPSQVDMESVPGSMGFSQVGPETLPYLATWGFIFIGLIWFALEAVKYLKLWRGSKTVIDSIQESVEFNQRKSWRWSLLLWLGTIIYVALIPVFGYAESCIVFSLPLSLAMIRSRSGGFKVNVLPWLVIGVILIPIILHFLFYRFLYVAFPTGPISRILAGG